MVIKENNETIIDKLKDIDEQLLTIDFRLSAIEKKIIEKIRNNSSSLSTFGDVIQGITPHDSYKGQSKEIIESRAYHFDSKKDDTCGKWLDGKNLNRYDITWKNQWLSYGHWLAAPRDKKFFKGNRILFREVPGKGRRIQANITDEEFYYGHSISPFIPFDEYKNDLEFILGIVNSKLLSWYGSFVLPNFGKDVFPKLNPNDIKLLPITNSVNNRKFELAQLVDKIIKEKKKCQTVDTTTLETQIDHLVYQLYDLTEEEINIIETA